MTICQHKLWVKLQHIDWKKFWNTYCKGLKAKYTRNYSKSSNKIASIIAMAGKRYIMACQKKTQIPSKHEKMLNLPNNHHNQMETLHTIFTHHTDKICENIKYLWGREKMVIIHIAGAGEPGFHYLFKFFLKSTYLVTQKFHYLVSTQKKNTMEKQWLPLHYCLK